MSAESFSSSRRETSFGSRVLARRLLGFAGERVAGKILAGKKTDRASSVHPPELVFSVEEADLQRNAI